MANHCSIHKIRDRIRRIKEYVYKDTVDDDKPRVHIVVTKEHQKRSKQNHKVYRNAKSGLEKLQQLGF